MFSSDIGADIRPVADLRIRFPAAQPQPRRLQPLVYTTA